MSRHKGSKYGKSSILLVGDYAHIVPSNDKSKIYTIDSVVCDDFVNTRNWCIDRGYLLTKIPLELNYKFDNKNTIRLHDYVMSDEKRAWEAKFPDINFNVDHIDRNRSNNLLENLRVIPAFANSLNTSRSGVNGTSAYNGVYLHSTYADGTYRWLVQITPKAGKQKHLSCHRTESAAAAAWNKAMISEYGLELMKPWLNQV